MKDNILIIGWFINIILYFVMKKKEPNGEDLRNESLRMALCIIPFYVLGECMSKLYIWWRK